ncbi:MAG: hypothetical protein ACK53Y_08800, partial [bacterium]
RHTISFTVLFILRWSIYAIDNHHLLLPHLPHEVVLKVDALPCKDRDVVPHEAGEQFNLDLQIHQIAQIITMIF